jgi:pimeloyl-ACP methyl ester carboxylesterase
LNVSGFFDVLRRIQVPVTLVHADGSNLVKPEKIALMQAALSRSRRVILPGGHNLHLEVPDAVADVIATSAALP